MMYLGDKAVGIATRMCKVASGVIEITKDSATANVVHNLGSDKIMIFMQRVNSDHSVINNSSTRYRTIWAFGITKNVMPLDLVQSYTYDNGTEQHFIDTGTSNTFFSGNYAYYGDKTWNYIPVTALTTANRGVIAVSLNEVSITENYIFEQGRWIWTAYALD